MAAGVSAVSEACPNSLLLPSMSSGQALISFNLSGQGLQCELATDLLGNFHALERLDLSHNALDIE